MSAVKVRIVDSITDDLQQIQDGIRVRAYEKFLHRAGNSHDELEDWLAAERELISILAASVTEDNSRIIANVDLPGIKSEDLKIEVTSQDALIHADIDGQTTAGSGSPVARVAFGVIRFPSTIDPRGIQVEHAKGILRLTAPLSEEAKALRRSA